MNNTKRLPKDWAVNGSVPTFYINGSVPTFYTSMKGSRNCDISSFLAPAVLFEAQAACICFTSPAHVGFSGLPIRVRAKPPLSSMAIYQPLDGSVQAKSQISCRQGFG